MDLEFLFRLLIFNYYVYEHIMVFFEKYISDYVRNKIIL